METTTAFPACAPAGGAPLGGDLPHGACRGLAGFPRRSRLRRRLGLLCFLPRDLPPLADGELDPAPPSKKALFMRLSASPLLLADPLTVRNRFPASFLLCHAGLFVGRLADRWWCCAEHLVGQGDRRQMLHNVGEVAEHLMGRDAVALALDPSRRG